MRIGIEATPSGERTLFVEREGKRQHLCSRRGPRSDGIRFHGENSGACRGLVVFIGLGLGHHITPFLEAGCVERVVVLEPVEELHRAVRDAPEIRSLLEDPRVSVHGGEQGRDFIDGIRERYDLLLAGSVKVLTHPLLRRLFPSEYGETEKRIKAQLDALANDGMTIGKFARTWLRNFAANRGKAEGCGVVSSLFGAFDGTVVIAGAGPSLDEAVGPIKAVRGRYTLLAADAAVGPLIRSGVMPDLIVTVDPQPIVYSHFEGVPRSVLGRIPAVLSLFSCPEVFDLFDRKYLFFTLHPLNRLFDAPRLVGEGAVMNHQSVGAFALDVALRMGFTSLYLAGFDLSYPRLRMYARGSFFHRYGLERWSRFSPFPGIEAGLMKKNAIEAPLPVDTDAAPGSSPFPVNGRLLTNSRLFEYRAELERIAAGASKQKKIKIVKIGRMGLTIEGAESIEGPRFRDVARQAAGTGAFRSEHLRFPVSTVPPGYGLPCSLPGAGGVRSDLALTLALRNRIFKGKKSGQEAMKAALGDLDTRWRFLLPETPLKFENPGSDI